MERSKRDIYTDWELIGFHMHEAILITAQQAGADDVFLEKLEATGLSEKPLPKAAALHALKEIDEEAPSRAMDLVE